MWLKIKIWFKGILFAVLLLYMLVFLLKNSDESTNIWFWFFKAKYNVSVLLLTFIAFLLGILGTILVRTTFSTIRQVREARRYSRTARLEREVAEMKSKAAMLRTRPASDTPEDVPDLLE